MDVFKVSIVIPCYNEEDNVTLLADELLKILSPYHDYEILFVNDGSVDGTLSALRELNRKNRKIRYLSFSRNFGHQIALKAGLDHSDGDCVISLDADLQHPPALIPLMIDKWQAGHEIVYTIREEDKRQSCFKKATSRLFYKLMNMISDINIDNATADFRLLDKKVVDVIRTMNEPSPFFRGIIPWVGFKKCSMMYSPSERLRGKSKYSFKKMVVLAMSGITSFSTKPLHLSTLLGLLISALSFAYGFYAVAVTLFTDKAISGWASVITSVLFIGGIQLIMLGIIGEYLGKLFIESKRRPAYIVEEKNDD